MTARFLSFQPIFELIQAERNLHNQIKARMHNLNNTLPFPTLKQDDHKTMTHKQIQNQHNAF